MSRSLEELRGLRLGLVQRSARIKRAAYLTKISFAEPTDQYLSVQVWWDDGGTLIKRFQFEEYFVTDSEKVRLKESLCRISQKFIREILTARGL